MHDKHNLKLYARSVFPKSFATNNYHQKRTVLTDALYWTMSSVLYKSQTDLVQMSEEIKSILTNKGIFDAKDVSKWVSQQFIPSANTLLEREHQKLQRFGKVWPMKEYLDHRESGASMHNEAMTFLLLLEPNLDLSAEVWSDLSHYLVLYTDMHSWQKDRKSRDLYNFLFSIQYELGMSEDDSYLFLQKLVRSRETLLNKKVERLETKERLFLETFKQGASLWCETTPRYKV